MYRYPLLLYLPPSADSVSPQTGSFLFVICMCVCNMYAMLFNGVDWSVCNCVVIQCVAEEENGMRILTCCVN